MSAMVRPSEAFKRKAKCGDHLGWEHDVEMSACQQMSKDTSRIVRKKTRTNTK